MDQEQKDIYSVDEPPPLARRRPAASEPSSAFRRFEARAVPRVQREEQTRVRRRRHRQTENGESPGRFVWFAVVLVVVVYCAALALSVLKTRHKPDLTAPANAPPPPVAAPAGPVYNAGPHPVRDEILSYKKALVFLRDGTADIDAGRLESAEKHLRDASELAPGIIALHSELARLYELKQDFAGAEKEWRVVLANNPESLSARLRLASVFLLGGQPANALETAQWALESDPYSVEGHQIAASALTSLKQPSGAIAHLRRLVSGNQDDLVAQNNLGAAYLAVNDYGNALKIFHDVLRVDPGNSVAFYNIAVVHARRGNVADAVDTLVQAARKLGATFVLTWTQSEDFDPIRAGAAFQRFVEQRGEPPSVEPLPVVSDSP